MKNKFFPKRFALISNVKSLRYWGGFPEGNTVHEMMISALQHCETLKEFQKFSYNISICNQQLVWLSGFQKKKIFPSEALKNSQDYTYHEKTLQYPEKITEILMLFRSNLNEFGVIYLGNRPLIPHFHVGIVEKKAAFACYPSKGNFYRPHSAQYIAGKMLWQGLNLPKIFHQLWTLENPNLLIGIDHKNRFLLRENQYQGFYYHIAENQKEFRQFLN